MKRNYPLFTIDRSKHSTYPFDYITCYDRSVGFIARVVPFFDNAPFNEFLRQCENIQDSEYTSIVKRFKIKGGLVILIEDFFYNFEWTNEIKLRIKTLLKKALKKYIHAEVERTPSNDLGIENQIKQQQETVERAKANYNDLVERAHGDKEYADFMIALAEATLETLQNYKDNFIFLNLN